MAKPHQGGGVGYAGAAQVDAHEVAQCLGVVDRVFDCFVGQAVPLLDEVHAQHALQANRWATPFATLGVIRLDDLHQPGPRNDLRHLRKEHLTPGNLLLALVFGNGETDLDGRLGVQLGSAIWATFP